MKKSLTALTFAAVLTAGISGAAMAQTTDDPNVPGHPRINEIDQRLENQQDRIDAGVKDGQINAKQEARDDAIDSKVSQQLSADEAKNGGHITKAEDVQLNKELNLDSKDIYDQRHEDVPGHPRISEIDQRLENQQDRIDAGVKDGQINAKQEARDDAIDSKVSQQLSADEAKDDGHITKGEQEQMNRELNVDSRQIYRQRHK
jgi:predicted carbohydrate-binding protein with CBM5 and CBM33 domain